MLINGLQKLTLLDYPGRTACTVFLGGCNFRCPFCHNFELASTPLSSLEAAIEEEEFYNFLKRRQGLLDGVCVTGGEPTLRKDLKNFLFNIKKLGYPIKLDTNGTMPKILQELLSEGLLDYIAMDIKAAPENYDKVAGVKTNSDSIHQSVAIIMNSNIKYEFRTTVVAPLHTLEDFTSIGQWLKGAKEYYLQPFVMRDTVPKKDLRAPTDEELQKYLDEIKKYIPNATIRGR